MFKYFSGFPPPLSCVMFQVAKGWSGERECLSQDTVAQPGRNPFSAPASEVSGIVHSVTRYQPQPLGPFRCGISCTSVFAFVLDVLLSRAGT